MISIADHSAAAAGKNARRFFAQSREKQSKKNKPQAPGRLRLGYVFG
jgi:hypothetical protein